MVFNSLMVVSVAHKSADAWQRLACFPISERVSSNQLLHLLFGFPFQQLTRLALCLWTFFCVPPPDSFYYYYYSSDSEDSSSSSSSSSD